MQVDYLIVGQGIAGTVFCEHVLKAGKSVAIIDDPALSNSSRVAGGLYNPITGRKMVKTWNCDQLFGYLEPFYQELEEKLATRFLIEKPIYRPFLSTEELNEWMGKSAEEAFIPYINEIKSTPAYFKDIYDPHGGILLNQCGYLDTATMIKAYGRFLQDSEITYRHEKFVYAELEVLANEVRYRGLSARQLVFTDGRLMGENPYFSWLPLNPVKGELLYIKTEHQFEVIYNRGVFVIPLSGGICKVGATYDHQNLDESVTSKGKEELKHRLRQLVKFDFEVIDQKAGIRPATIDRKPFVGVHPQHERLAIFNGLGTKGVSLAPFYAKQLLDCLEFGGQIDAEVNIERFFSLF